MKARLSALAAFLALALVALWFVAPRPVGAEGPPGDVGAVASASPGDRIILVTGPLMGTLEPCRCSEGMLGGLPRRAALIARFATKPAPLVLDLGDLARPEETSATLLELMTRAALATLAATTPTGSKHAIALGCADARIGLDRLARLSAESGGSLVWLSTNVRRRDPSSRFLEPMLQEGELCVLAVIDPDLISIPEGYEVLAPGEAVVQQLAKLPVAPRRVVVLFHGDSAAAERTLGAVAGVSLVVCGHAEKGEPTRTLASGASLVTLETKGQRLRALALAPIGKGAALHAEASHDLDGLVPDAHAARERLDAFYEEATRLVPDLPRKKLDEAGGHFAGAESCRLCHAEAYKIWQGTSHGSALTRLKEKDPKRAGLAECLRCHTTGFGLESGWTQDGAADLGSVGCESCHGVGSNHQERATRSGDATGFGRPTGTWPVRWRERCLVCHDPANSPGFELGAYLEKIRHWKIEKR